MFCCSMICSGTSVRFPFTLHNRNYCSSICTATKANRPLPVGHLLSIYGMMVLAL